MLFTTTKIENNEIDSINNFFQQFDAEVKTVSEDQAQEETCVSKYISSLVCGQYQKSVEDIQNTKVGNKIIRKRNLQQVMKESFFYGANRFGNNFIA